MNCPDELTWSIYADGELVAAEVRRAELHLVSCRHCRSRVVALQEEAAILTDALRERERAPALRRARPEPTRDLAFGVPAAIAGVTALLSIAGVLIDLRLPGGIDLLDPRRWMGAYEMLFDTVFVMRSRLPWLFELATSVGAVAAVSALGCAAVQALSQRLTRSSSLHLVLLVLVAVLGVPEAARAIDLRLDRDTYVASAETVPETLVCTGEVVTIDGTVDGDLVVGAERVVVRGTVTGNVYVFGDEVEIEGVVRGSVLVVAESARLDGSVEGSAVLAGGRVTLADGARVARDVALFGEGARVEGTVSRDVTFGGEWIEVRGAVGRTVHVLAAERVGLLDGARIGGDVRGRVWKGAEAVERAPGATIGGELRVEAESIVREHYLAHYLHARFYVSLLVAAAAAFVFGLLLHVLDPRLFEADAPDARGFFRSLGIGFVALLAAPFVLLLGGLTVVGIPVAVLGGFVLVSALYTSWVLVAGMLGLRIVAPAGPGIGRFAPSLLAGVLLLILLSALPFVGAAVRIVAVLFGLGCLFDRVRALHALNLRAIRMDD